MTTVSMSCAPLENTESCMPRSKLNASLGVVSVTTEPETLEILPIQPVPSRKRLRASERIAVIIARSIVSWKRSTMAPSSITAAFIASPLIVASE